LAARAAEERITRIATRLASGAKTDVNPPVVAAIDEAFAGFSRTDTRVARVDRGRSHMQATRGEQPSGQVRASRWEPLKREIEADLSAQLEALDDQRERLARLLSSIDRNLLSDF
jgi:hypothetical protein